MTGSPARAIMKAPGAAGLAGGPERAMAYGHAERNLAAIWRLEAETEELLSSLLQSGSAVALAATDREGELTAPQCVSAWDARATSMITGVRGGTVMTR